jgi:S1-C subfamily serine protease
MLLDLVRVLLPLLTLIAQQGFQQSTLPPQNQTGQTNPIIISPADTPWETVEGIPAYESPDNEIVVDKRPAKVKIVSNGNPSPRAVVEPPVDKNEYEKRLDNLKKLRRVESMLEELIPKVTPSIVSIGDTASGVIVKPSGIVITASHVTRKAGRILIIRLQDGRTVKGITLGSNAANDTSAIQLLGNGPWPYLKTVAPSYTAQAGQWCVAFGYPLSWPRDKPASGRIGRVTGQYRGKMVTDCPIMGGDSGGALVDMNGNLLGINSSVRLDVTQNLHVPIVRYREDWKYMMARQDVDIDTAPSKESNSTPEKKTGKPYLGIYGESSWKSVRIRDVRRDSPAEKAGLLPEDVIWQIDKTPIESFAELLEYLSEREGGDRIAVGINRFGVNLEIIVTLDQR